MQAVVMAGGVGRRLAPYTTVLPKPLMPLLDRPIIDVILRQLVRDGMETITISVGHLGSLIESWVRNRGDYGAPIQFAYEDEPLGTAGALGTIENLDDTFVAMNGDILTTLSVSRLLDHHRATRATATVAIKQRTLPVEYGVVHTAPNSTIVALEEKPRLEYRVSMGMYAFEPRILEYVTPREPVDFPDLLQRAIGAGEAIVAHEFDGYWRDIGNRDDYEAAISDFADDQARFIGNPE